MKIIPAPKQISMGESNFTLTLDTVIVLNTKSVAYNKGSELKGYIEDILGFDLKIEAKAKYSSIELLIEATDDAYEIHISETKVLLKASTEGDLFYAVQTFKQMLVEYKRHIPCCEIKDSPSFQNRGYYYDATRGKVPTLETLKRLADTAALYKLNQLQLYIEHTYLFDNQSEVWTVTDALTSEEIMAFDDYCADRYIELVPSISTFGHLYELLQSESFKHLSEIESFDSFSFEDRMSHHTLNVSLTASIDLVKAMIDQFMPLLRSNQFNICADETFDLGTGKNKKLAEEMGKSRLYVEFLNKIIHHVKDRDKKVMFWGDIIIKHPEFIESIPKDVICLNWWYWLNYEEEKVAIISEHGFDQYMCPGVNGWNYLMNDHKMAYDNIKLMTDYGKKYKAIGILNTDWGDYGHWNEFANSIPGLIYGAAASWGDERSYSELNEAIDQLHFNCSLTNVLNKIFDNHHLRLAELVPFIEKNQLKYMDKIEVTREEILHSNKVLLDCVDTLQDCLSDVPVALRQDVHAYVMSANGIMIFNEIFLHIRKVVYNDNTELIRDGHTLAVALEYWFLDFKKSWYKQNKASELYRNKEFVQKVSKWLRTESK